jgi:hypothetical protein
MDPQTNGWNKAEMKMVYAITERGGRSFWTKIGVGFMNKDGSITLKLDAIPVSGQVQVRDWEDNWERRSSSAGDHRGRAPRDEAPDSLV